MGKLILEMQISIDGYMAGIEGQTDWMIWNWGPDWTWDEALQDFHTRLTLSASHIVISSQMAQEGFIAHWKQAAERRDNQHSFASHLAQAPKTVISASLTKDQPVPGGWENVNIANDPVKAVEQLKKESSGNILVYGGASLVSGLLKHQLIDELYLLVNPVAIGKGKTVFNKIQYFNLEGAVPYSCGVAGLHYLSKTINLI